MLDEVGRSRLVVTMRYHGAVAALLHDRPAVLLNYSPKMASLGSEGNGWARVLDLGGLESGQLVDAVSDAWAAHSRAAEALDELRGRLRANETALDELAAVGT